MVIILKSNEFSQISMACRANEQHNTTVYKDEPLILSVSMVNEDAAHAASFNVSLEDQVKQIESKFIAKKITVEEFKGKIEEIKKEMLKVRIYRIGGPKGWPYFIKFQTLLEGSWEEVDWPLWLLMHYPSDNVITLDGWTSCYAEFGLDSEENKRPRGEKKVKAIIEIDKNITVESNIVTINFLKEKIPEKVKDKEEILIVKGRYAYKRGLYDKAIEYIQRALQVNPHSLPSLNLMGDIEKKRGNLDASLSAYEKALEEFNEQYPNSYDPPLLIERNIGKLRTLIKKRKTAEL
jgi:tetratricopeptide (TPR) repeat protein